jgi:hypothetical protein
LALASLFVALGALWVAGAGPLKSGVMLAVVALLPPMLLFAVFTRGPSPRSEQVLHTVEVRR